MKILIVTSNFPYPPKTGGKVRLGNLLRQIAPYHEVTLLSLLDSADERIFIANLQPYCQNIETVLKQRHRSRGKLLLKLIHTMLKGEPPRNGIAQYDEMVQRIQEITAREDFDVIHLDQSQIAPYIEFARTGKAACFITLHDVGFVQQKRILKTNISWKRRFWTFLDMLFLEKWEPKYMARHFDCCIAVSDVDAGLLLRMNPSLKTKVVPNGVDTAGYQILPEITDAPNILYIGKMDYEPNADAVRFFYSEIFPIIKKSIPNARLTIVGQGAEKALKGIAHEDVTITGYVESVVPFYERSLISVVPLRAGGGTRLKILESMAFGRPVVSTTIGCEGLTVTHNKNILIADSPLDFAKHSVQLLRDPELRRCLASNGRQLVESTYDWGVIGQKLLHIYEEEYELKRTNKRGQAVFPGSSF